MLKPPVHRSPIFVALISLGVAALGQYLWFTWSSDKAFQESHTRLFESEAKAAEQDILDFLGTQRRLVSAFAKDNAEAIYHLSHGPENEALLDDIAIRLKRIFPHSFTFTITDAEGHLLLDNIDGFVGEICQRDIDNLLKVSPLDKVGDAFGEEYETYVHPQANNYHFDVMSRWHYRGRNGIFFVSFHPNKLKNILAANQSPRHLLYLLHRDRKGLIEATAKGGRDEIAATRDIWIDDDEQSRIAVERSVPGTLWVIAGLTTTELFSNHSKSLWTQAALTLGLLTVIVGFAVSWGYRGEVRKNEQQKIVNAKENAEAANRAKSEFLANMSHELRTPLNAILGFTEIMVGEHFGPVGNEKYKEFLADIHASGAHLLDIVNDVLDLSRIEAGAVTLDMGDLDLNEVIGASLRIVRNHVEDKSMSVEVKLEPSSPVIQGDERMIRQIVLNLVSNSIKFSDPGGMISVRTAMEPSGETSLTIADTGVGISQDNIPKVLEPFGQAASAFTREHGGTGLGLSLAKKFAELHGATFKIESKVGEGTEITIRFPPGSTKLNET